LEILNRSIAASWIVLGVIALRLLLKKAPKWIAVLLWAVVAVRLLCPFTIESVMSLIPSAETVSPDIMYQDTPQINSGIPVINATVNPYIGEHFGPTPYYSANPLQILIPSVAYGWLLGVFGMFSYALISWGLLKRKLKTAVLLRENIFQSENVASPFVLGILKPKIYLPFEMQEQDASYVVAHERAHIRRKDHWWKPFGYLLLAIHWFNPLMWLGYLLLCRDIELACDEKVIKELGYEQKADYSQALLTCSVNRRIIAACPLAFGEVGVKERVKSVLKYKKPALWIVTVAVAVCVLFAGCFLTDRLNKDRTKDLNDWQQMAVKAFPELCCLDSKKGLDVYVIEKADDYYEYYLTAHRDTPYNCSSPEIKEAAFLCEYDMQWVLYAYNIAQSDVHIIILPWENPDTGFVSSYFSDIHGETP
jgi:beta-lactamase regulating signal transducer with metallopeptidase domain